MGDIDRGGFLRIASVGANTIDPQPQTGSGVSLDKSPEEFNDLLHFQRGIRSIRSTEHNGVELSALARKQRPRVY